MTSAGAGLGEGEGRKVYSRGCKATRLSQVHFPSVAIFRFHSNKLSSVDGVIS